MNEVDRHKELKDLLHSLKTMAPNDTNAHFQLARAKVDFALVEAVETLQAQITSSIRDLRSSIKFSVQQLIDSNKELATSSNKHADKMTKLTNALVFVGIVQAVATVAQALIALLD